MNPEHAKEELTEAANTPIFTPKDVSLIIEKYAALKAKLDIAVKALESIANKHRQDYVAEYAADMLELINKPTS